MALYINNNFMVCKDYVQSFAFFKKCTIFCYAALLYKPFVGLGSTYVFVMRQASGLTLHIIELVISLGFGV